MQNRTDFNVEFTASMKEKIKKKNYHNIRVVHDTSTEYEN